MFNDYLKLKQAGATLSTKNIPSDTVAFTDNLALADQAVDEKTPVPLVPPVITLTVKQFDPQTGAELDPIVHKIDPSHIANELDYFKRSADNLQALMDDIQKL